MRKEDVEQLQQPYRQGTPLQECFADAVGVVLPGVRGLHREVLADFDEKKYGIGWWAPHPGTSRRILIGDHLLMCIAGIETNLVEARLHLLETRDAREQQDRFVAHAVKHDRRVTPSIRLPAREKATDDLPRHTVGMHIAGFFRAVGSALDCLGAGVVGVLALPTSLRKADIDRARAALKKVKSPDSEGEKTQVAFAADLERMVATAGPKGWLEWATDYRNMLVHRRRRMLMARLDRRGATLLAAEGSPVVLAREVLQLAQDPALSDVEALLLVSAPVLTEDAAATLDGVMASALMLVQTAPLRSRTSGGDGAQRHPCWRSRQPSGPRVHHPCREASPGTHKGRFRSASTRWSQRTASSDGSNRQRLMTAQGRSGTCSTEGLHGRHR